MYEVLNKDKKFEKFFKEYLEKESKVEVAGRTRASKLWPIIEEALKSKVFDKIILSSATIK